VRRAGRPDLRGRVRLGERWHHVLPLLRLHGEPCGACAARALRVGRAVPQRLVLPDKPLRYERVRLGRILLVALRTRRRLHVRRRVCRLSSELRSREPRLRPTLRTAVRIRRSQLPGRHLPNSPDQRRNLRLGLRSASALRRRLRLRPSVSVDAMQCRALHGSCRGSPLIGASRAVRMTRALHPSGLNSTWQSLRCSSHMSRSDRFRCDGEAIGFTMAATGPFKVVLLNGSSLLISLG
jgi:hypothetical protein